MGGASRTSDCVMSETGSCTGKDVGRVGQVGGKMVELGKLQQLEN